MGEKCTCPAHAWVDTCCLLAGYFLIGMGCFWEFFVCNEMFTTTWSLNVTVTWHCYFILLTELMRPILAGSKGLRSAEVGRVKPKVLLTLGWFLISITQGRERIATASNYANTKNIWWKTRLLKHKSNQCQFHRTNIETYYW